MDTREAKLENIRRRIDSIGAAVLKAQEHLDSGKHADWRGFRPVFYGKLKDGKELPPHRDWVRNVYIPSKMRDLHRAERTLERLEQKPT